MIHSLPADIKEAARIQRRREAEEERKKRILNPRIRMFGVRGIFVILHKSEGLHCYEKKKF